jgi:hypothetical protein
MGTFQICRIPFLSTYKKREGDGPRTFSCQALWGSVRECLGQKGQDTFHAILELLKVEY